MVSNKAVYLFAGGVLLLIGYIVAKKMAKAGSPFFKFGYFLYTKTRVGQIYYRRELNKARRKFPNEGHSVCEAKNFNGKDFLKYFTESYSSMYTIDGNLPTFGKVVKFREFDRVPVLEEDPFPSLTHTWS